MDHAVRAIRAEAADHRLTLLGEMHGTREIPDLVGKLMAAVGGRFDFEVVLPMFTVARLIGAQPAP